MVHIVAWAFGMHALDLRMALSRIEDVWACLMVDAEGHDEGRRDEVPEFACWVAGKEIDKRADQSGVDPETGEDGRGRTLTLASVESVKPRRVRWLWDARVPLGVLTLLGGREGIGKSILAYTFAARITKGLLEGELHGQPRPVVIAATEDSWDHTIVPRLIVAGADRSLVKRVTVTAPDDQPSTLVLPHDLSALHQAAVEVGAARILLDPLMSRLDAALDSHKDGEVRQALEPLVDYADRGATRCSG